MRGSGRAVVGKGTLPEGVTVYELGLKRDTLDDTVLAADAVHQDFGAEFGELPKGNRHRGEGGVAMSRKGRVSIPDHRELPGNSEIQLPCH